MTSTTPIEKASSSRASSNHENTGKVIHDDGEHTQVSSEKEVDVQGPVILSTKQFLPIFLGMAISVFLISLDNTVISTAQVPIVNHLGGANLVLWLPTAFLLAQASFTLFFGQVLQIFTSKWVYLWSLFGFEIGSLICAVSPSMGALIAGRTVAGIGASGLFMACFQILIETTSMTNRAQYMGFLGAIFGISMIAAPSIGGALSQDVSWRWCFYINLPCAVVAAAGIIFILKATKPLGTPLHSSFSVQEKLKKLDVVGSILISGFFIMIILPIQLSTSNGWNSALTITPLVCSILVLPLIYLWFRYIGEEKALMPIGLLTDKNLIGCCLTSFLGYWSIIVVIYFIPFMFQTVKGSSPVKAGVELLALMIPASIGSIVVGVAAKKFGQYYPFFIIGVVFGGVGSGLAWHLTANSASSYQIGTQILLGLSVGPLIQMPILAAQANTRNKALMSKANGMVSVAQRLGGGIGGSVANAILYSQYPIQPTDIFEIPLGPVRDAMLAGLTKTIRIVYVSAVPIYFFALLAILLLIKITDVRDNKQTKKIDLLRRIFRLKRRSDVDGIVA